LNFYSRTASSDAFVEILNNSPDSASHWRYRKKLLEKVENLILIPYSAARLNAKFAILMLLHICLIFSAMKTKGLIKNKLKIIIKYLFSFDKN
jgi:hypothetical protein